MVHFGVDWDKNQSLGFYKKFFEEQKAVEGSSDTDGNDVPDFELLDDDDVTPQ